MNDYRSIIYKTYNIKFNKVIANISLTDIESMHKHYSVKVLPYLKKFNKEIKILELGCGAGYLLDYLKLNGFTNLCGIDISAEQLELAREKKLNVFEYDVTEFLQQNNKQWDVIFAFDFIEHFTKDELLKMTSLINKSLAEDGILFIRTPNGEGLFPNGIIYGDLTHQTIFNSNSLAQLLSVSGFSSFIFFENAPVNKNIKGVVRFALWKIIKLFLNIIKIVEVGNPQKIWTREFYCVAKK